MAVGLAELTYTDAMVDQSELLAWGCIFVGVYLAGYALSSMRSGETQGYYRDHRHRSDDADSRFGLWVWFRLFLGVVLLVAGVASLIV